MKVTFQPISEVEATPCSAATWSATATATCTAVTPRKSAGPSPRRSATRSRPSLSAREVVGRERVRLPQDSCKKTVRGWKRMTKKPQWSLWSQSCTKLPRHKSAIMRTYQPDKTGSIWHTNYPCIRSSDIVIFPCYRGYSSRQCWLNIAICFNSLEFWWNRFAARC